MNTESDSHVENRTISFLAANLYGIALMPVMAAIILVPFALRSLRPTFSFGIQQVMLFIGAILVGVILHEFLHAVGWVAVGRVKWHDIEFGIKSLTPYAHCKVPVTASTYRIGILLPGIALGLIPGWIGSAVNSGWLVAFGLVMFISAAGDLMVLWLIRDLPPTAQVLDHPSEVGCQVIHR
jgi:hypothetical protein